jgi:sugar lactone lactonase YvrE
VRYLTLILCLTLSFHAAAEDLRSVSQAAMDAYQSKDWAAYLENAKKLDTLRPGHPRILYNLSGAYALNGETDTALETLARVAAMGVVYPAAEDDDFVSIRDEPAFETILAAFRRNGEETGTATVALSLDLKGRVPEGVARDPGTGTLFVSLVRDGAVLMAEPDRPPRKLPLENVWSVTGLQYDPVTQTLWFATAATPMFKRMTEDAVGRSALVAWDVKRSRVISRWDLDNTDAAHWLGDLILSPDGTVYATDSRTPAIYRVTKDRDTIEKWMTSDAFVSLQGLAVTPDGRRLYVADYARGIWSIDTRSGDAALLPSPSDATVLGIDGLYMHDGDLVAIQNGTRPHRVIRVHLDEDGNRIERVETLEANRPEFDEPTLGTIQDGSLWFVATSGWGSFTDDGRLREGAAESPVVVMKRELD